MALNLTAASHVFLMDPWWNPAVEAQAQDRIHRLGVIRSTPLWRLLKLHRSLAPATAPPIRQDCAKQAHLAMGTPSIKHRLCGAGQYKPIHAVRFIIGGTIEERILKLQDKKQAVFEGTVGKDAAALVRVIALLPTSDLKCKH